MSPAVTPGGIHSPPRPPGVLRPALASALRIDWSAAEPLAALRCTIGVGVPLLFALAAGQPAAGMFTAIGAVSAGFGSFQGAYRSRAATMLFAAGGMAVSLTVGSLAGHSGTLATLVTAAWGLGAGLLVSLGAAASFVGLQSAVALIVAVAYPAAPMDALGRGLLVVGGGLVQVVLVVSVWPLRRFGAERSLVARIYRSLAAYAGDLPAGTLLPPEPHTLAGSPEVDADPHPFARSSDVLVFRGLFDEAERIRASLAALSLSPARDDPAMAATVAAILREIAAAVDEGRAPMALEPEWDALDQLTVSFRNRGASFDRLVSQLRAASRMAMVPAAGDQSDGDAVRRRTLPPVRQAVVTLVANLSLRSTAMRHALRLSATLAIATALSRGYALPRGYWLPMTALLVLKPEFRETFVTGITRAIGTLVGAGVATLLVAGAGSEPAEVTVLLLAFVWAGYALFRASYTAFTVCITGYIVLLLYLAHAPAPATATYRAIDTMLGGALALAMFRAWPTWEARRLPEVIAHQAEMLARYTDILIGTYVEPASWDAKRLAQARSDARLARSNSEASVERMLGEPAGGGWRAELALGVLAALRRYALGALALHAGVDERPVHPVPALAPVRACLVERLHLLAAVLREERPAECLASACQPVVSEPAIGGEIAAQSELLVESVDNLAELLGTHLKEPHPDPAPTATGKKRDARAVSPAPAPRAH